MCFQWNTNSDDLCVCKYNTISLDCLSCVVWFVLFLREERSQLEFLTFSVTSWYLDTEQKLQEVSLDHWTNEDKTASSRDCLCIGSDGCSKLSGKRQEENKLSLDQFLKNSQTLHSYSSQIFSFKHRFFCSGWQQQPNILVQSELFSQLFDWF